MSDVYDVRGFFPPFLIPFNFPSIVKALEQRWCAQFRVKLSLDPRSEPLGIAVA